MNDCGIWMHFSIIVSVREFKSIGTILKKTKYTAFKYITVLGNNLNIVVYVRVIIKLI